MTAAIAVAPLRLGADIKVQLRRIGVEQQPLLVVDNVLDDPDAMIEAARAASFYAPPHTNYPGLNAVLPEAYYRMVVTALRGPIEAAFGLSREVYVKYFGFFALATSSAREASSIQKVPHCDGPDPGRLAMVHYLCRGPFGGTGFFRHRATGLQSVDATRHGAYLAAIQAELAAADCGPAAYADGTLANYELIGEAEKVFNRLIVYRNHVLHSALLGPDAGSDDPARGRLTSNGFIEAADSG
ncbi:DUF6445 family protein [Caulobacter sp. DWR1-3-2b1]|uniref:DUF6445 family protein n=1 Tax=Caulobacter sp. DWR1-3-2b1 TaxID=2804670 RepID=UPI003CEE1FB9